MRLFNVIVCILFASNHTIYAQHRTAADALKEALLTLQKEDASEAADAVAEPLLKETTPSNSYASKAEDRASDLTQDEKVNEGEPEILNIDLTKATDIEIKLYENQFMEMFKNANLESGIGTYGLLIKRSGAVCGRLAIGEVYENSSSYHGYLHLPFDKYKPTPEEIQIYTGYDTIQFQTKDGEISVYHKLSKLTKLGWDLRSGMNIDWTTKTYFATDGGNSANFNGIALIFSILPDELERMYSTAKGVEVKCD